MKSHDSVSISQKSHGMLMIINIIVALYSNLQKLKLKLGYRETFKLLWNFMDVHFEKQKPLEDFGIKSTSNIKPFVHNWKQAVNLSYLLYIVVIVVYYYNCRIQYI